jgi:hypothetical protein
VSPARHKSRLNLNDVLNLLGLSYELVQGLITLKSCAAIDSRPRVYTDSRVCCYFERPTLLYGYIHYLGEEEYYCIQCKICDVNLCVAFHITLDFIFMFQIDVT